MTAVADISTEATERSPHPVIDFKRLSKTFGKSTVLSNVDFNVQPGEVHCLLGHNGSGKSTLIKILGGIHPPDDGSKLMIGGVAQTLPLSARQVHQAGIRFVHQSLGLIASLTVSEHFAQDQLDGRHGWYLSPKAQRVSAQSALRRFGVDVDPDALIGDLSAVNRALVAIVRAVSSLDRRPGGIAGSLLILDEPTAFLPRQEVDMLFQTVRKIAAQGAGVVLVTHDTDEVLSIADRVTVLRDGKVVGVVERADLRRDGLVRLIVGHDLVSGKTAQAVAARKVAAEVSITSAGSARDVNFTLGEGEIVGVTGLIGSGYDDIVHALFGSKPATGDLRFKGRNVALARQTPQAAIKGGIAFIPSDRPGAGATLDLRVAENVALLALARVANPWFFSPSGLNAAVMPWLRDSGVKPLDPTLEMGRLSGGNQQKVVLAKWLAAQPDLLLLDEPTQGIDIGAREQIFATLRRLAGQGMTVLCASTDHAQLAELCDRVLILSRGRLVRVMSKAELSPHDIGEAVLDAPINPSPERNPADD